MRDPGRIVACTHLARWLGPWASDATSPARIAVAPWSASVDGHLVEARRYTPPGRPRGTVVLALGLHPHGPDDPRADRFARVLAGTGCVVVAPYTRPFMALTLVPEAVDAFGRAMRAIVASGDRPPGPVGVMSISFGSLLALRAASDPVLAEHVRRVVVFGGYADIRATLDFALSGELEGHRLSDDLGRNLPVVYLQVLDRLVPDAADRAALATAWRAYIDRTWHDPALRDDRVAQAVFARDQAQALPGPLRDLFLRGCAADDGGIAEAEAALAAMDFAHLDPRPYLGGLRAPVHVVHGVGDGVIPYTEAARLAAALPPHVDRRVHLTGLFGHTGSHAGLRDVAREVGGLAGMLWALAGLGRGA